MLYLGLIVIGFFIVCGVGVVFHEKPTIKVFCMVSSMLLGLAFTHVAKKYCFQYGSIVTCLIKE